MLEGSKPMSVTAKASIPAYSQPDLNSMRLGEVEFTDESLNGPMIAIGVGDHYIVYVKASDLLSCVKWITGNVR